MWNYCYILFILLIYAGILTTNGYDTPSGPQYHIQTDEGPERYFRYQTLSGQYRKEKRLEDGTVIGTYAWIDDDGILRQRDYIADSAGYRILKSKNLYVGRHVPVGEAVKAAKKHPASSGTLVAAKSKPVRVRPVVTVPYQPLVTTVAPPVTPIPEVTTISPAKVITPAHTSLGPGVLSPLSSTTPGSIFFSSNSLGPHVEISNNALPSSTALPYIPSTEKPYVDITPHPILSTTGDYGPSQTSETSYFNPTSTPSSLQYLQNNPQSPSNVQYSPSPYESLPTYTEPAQNTLDYNPYVSPISKGYVFQNGPTYPIDRNGHTYRGNKRFTDPRIGNGYNKQHPEYDGVSVTNDGFRYYIPRAYHEEETLPGNEKTGSFGYIDPFGIRRVIYYNAKPGEGFQHRKNNRYVGFDATPYDPRPY